MFIKRGLVGVAQSIYLNFFKKKIKCMITYIIRVVSFLERTTVTRPRKFPIPPKININNGVIK